MTLLVANEHLSMLRSDTTSILFMEYVKMHIFFIFRFVPSLSILLYTLIYSLMPELIEQVMYHNYNRILDCVSKYFNENFF